VRGRPKTLGAEFIDDLLEVTGGGRARDFETARDHAIIRILRSEGIRRLSCSAWSCTRFPPTSSRTRFSA
jgi:site-specific recombinase XerC